MAEAEDLASLGDHAPLAASLNAPQPAPLRGHAPATWDLVIADMRERDGIGEKKYGVRHQHDNGRDHAVDAYQESLDQTLYLRAEIERQKQRDLIIAAAKNLDGYLARAFIGMKPLEITPALIDLLNTLHRSLQGKP